MRNRLSPVWFETMPLDPLYWQQWDRHSRHTMNVRLEALSPYGWGFHDLEFEKESLSRGQLAIVRCSGIMPDGLVFDAPGMNQLPGPRSVRDQFPASRERLEVFLAVPSERVGGSNCQITGTPARPVRYSGEQATVADDNTGLDERPITVAQPNLSLLLGGESYDEYTVLQVAELVRTAAGGFALEGSFIPPLLIIGGSDALMDLTAKVLDNAVGKATVLSDRRRQLPSGQVEFTPTDLTTLGVLQTVNRIIPLLSHAQRTKQCHPFALYEMLASFTGELMTFSADQDLRPADLPLYNHENPGEALRALQQKIARLLVSDTRNVFVIPLRKEPGDRLAGDLPAPAALSGASFYISVTGDLADAKLQAELPKKLKLASQEDLPMLLASALPGVPLSGPVPPPPGLQVLADRWYYQVQTAGRLWESILRTRRVALSIVPEYRTMTFGLYCVNDR